MQVARLADGRVHLQDGPIDLLLRAEGPGREAAERAAVAAFDGLLRTLAGDLSVLRRPIDGSPPPVSGPVARRMVQAVAPFADRFVTPMAAVAGAVSDHLLRAMLDAAPDLTRAWVNDGGDIAFHLTAGQTFEVGLVDDLRAPALAGTATVSHGSDPQGDDPQGDDPHGHGLRGVATSGRGGRSFSLGIADAVTVMARDAATADVVATLVANAVDLPGHPAILRGPASAQDPDSDLGDLPVVLEVGTLNPEEVATALDSGYRASKAILDLLPDICVILFLGKRFRIVGAPAARVTWLPRT